MRATAPSPGPGPGFAVTVEVAVLTVRGGGLEALLGRRRSGPYAAAWALPGDVVGLDEDVDDAAGRVSTAAAGLPVAHLEQLGTYGAPDRDPRGRVVSVAYLALLPIGADPAPPAGGRGGELLPVEPLVRGRVAVAFDHGRILGDAAERTRSKLEYTTLAAALLPEEFTIGDLRRVYESVWGVSLHHSNFARKVRSVAGFVEPTGRRTATSGAPELFRKGPASIMMPPLMRPEEPAGA